MRFFLIFSFLLTITGCGNTNKVYWCGDHPCLNKKERKAYFEKNFTVEVRELNKKNKKKFSPTSEIMIKAKKNEKERIRNEKNILKQAKLNEKKRIIEEKKSIKKARLDEKNNSKKKNIEPIEIEEMVEDINEINNNEENNNIKDKIVVEGAEASEYKFTDLVKKIKEKNKSKSFPDINKIPN